MQIDLANLSANHVYHLVTQTLIPRPVAWVLSENVSGSFNLAPFSYFTAVCSDPPLLMLSVGKKPDGSFKDTRVNIEQRSHFVVHLCHPELAAVMTETSRTLPHGESELDQVGLKTARLDGFPLPRLEQCRVAFACTLEMVQEIGTAPQALIFGRIQQVYLDDSVTSVDAKNRLTVHADRVDPVGRLGASEYATFGEILRIPRPD